MSTPPSSSALQRRLGISPRGRIALLASIIGAAAALLLGIEQPGLRLTIDHPWTSVLVMAAFAFSERVVFHVEARNEAVAYTPSEIPLAIGLLLLNPFELVAARLLGALPGMALVRRSPLFKLSYNAALLALEAMVAVALFRWLSTLLDPTVLATWGAMIVSLAVAQVIGGMLVALAMAQFEGGLAEKVARELRDAPVLHLPGVLFAASVAVPTSLDSRLVLVTLAPAPLLYLVLRSHGSLLGRFADLTSLHSFTRNLGNALDLQAIGDAAAQELVDHMRADNVAVRLWHENGTPIDAGSGVARTCLPVSPSDARWAEVWSRARVTPVAQLGPTLRNSLESSGLDGGLVAVLADTAGPLGVIAVGSRNGAATAFDDDDISRLATMTQQLTIVTRKGHLHEQITFEATHDRLTGLPNRSHFEQRISDAAAAGTEAAILLIDLDRFKQINDTFGHHAGDELLSETARRIAESCRAGDLVARFGGDEFAVFTAGLDASDAEALAERISERLERSFDIGPATVAIGASVGIALMPEHGTDAASLLRSADLAMYDAKSRRVRARTYRQELATDTADRLTLLDDLRSALRNQEITVHFQPQLQLSNGTICGVEALARWEHPVRGRIAPDVFIELAEQAGLIEELTRQVLTLATAAATRWHADGHALAISVNISAQSLLDERLESIVTDALLDSGMDPSYLVLEITESTMMSDEDQTPQILAGLSELGVNVSVDDFGTGFSSLVNLRSHDVNEIKIDKSFVMQMTLEHDDEVIVRSTIELGHNLGLRVVAEGVETPVVLAKLSEMGCDVAQGYGISRPLPPDLFDRWLADRVTRKTDDVDLSSPDRRATNDPMIHHRSGD